MKRYRLYLIWGALFILCAGFGFIQEPDGAMKALLVMLSAGFFVPPVMLLWQGKLHRDQGKLRLVRNLSALSLGLTLAALILNFLSVFLSASWGNFLYGLLVVLSTPMVCSQYWAPTMFVWACLLLTSMTLLKRINKE